MLEAVALLIVGLVYLFGAQINLFWFCSYSPQRRYFTFSDRYDHSCNGLISTRNDGVSNSRLGR